MHWHYYIDVFGIIYLGIVYFADAISKWSRNTTPILLFPPPSANAVTVIALLTTIYTC